MNVLLLLLDHFLRVFHTIVIVDGLLQESEWQQVSWSHQDYSQDSGRS